MFCGIFRLWGCINVVIFNILIFFAAVSHLRAVLSDPGIVPLPNASMDFSDMHSGHPPKETVNLLFYQYAKKKNNNV
jgi:hypothetical protein